MSAFFLLFLMSADVNDANRATKLADSIDRHVESTLKAEKVTPEALADDAEFLRRIHLDLFGTIPTEPEVRRFLALKDASKRTNLIAKLLRDPRHADHFARTWRSILLPEIETDRQVDFFRPGFEAWLKERRAKNVGMDVIVRDLLSVPIAGPNGLPEIVLRDLRKPNPLGFYAAKDAKPENIASSVTRIFLGIRIECAQCHNHPFGHWTQNQFWNQAAFFAGIERTGEGVFSPLVEQTDKREIQSSDSKIKETAIFLDKKKPDASTPSSLRGSLAHWMTSPENHQFSMAMVNRIWAQLMGVGIVEPVDDFDDANLPSHPKLLEELASEFQKSGYDLDLLIGAICQSRTYQRTSRTSDSTPTNPRLFHRMAIKQLSGEQFANSLWFALGRPLEDPNRVGSDRDRASQKFVELFQGSERYSDPQTSILQSLTLRNDHFLNEAVSQLAVLNGAPKPPSAKHEAKALELSKTVPKLLATGKMMTGNDSMIGGNEGKPTGDAVAPNVRNLSPAALVDTLYLATLSRFPTEKEKQRHLKHLNSAPKDQAQVGADILWVLINSMEFRCNH